MMYRQETPVSQCVHLSRPADTGASSFGQLARLSTRGTRLVKATETTHQIRTADRGENTSYGFVSADRTSFSTRRAQLLTATDASNRFRTADEARQWIGEISRFRELTPEDYEVLLLLDTDVKKIKQVMSSSAVDALPRVSDAALIQDPCAVCLCEMTEGQDICLLPSCRHLFHMGCLRSWLTSEKSKCPLCGQPCDMEAASELTG